MLDGLVEKDRDWDVDTSRQLNFSSSTRSDAVAPWRSILSLLAAVTCSSSVRKFAAPGVLGRKKKAMMATRMVIAPSTKKIQGQPL